MIKELNYFSIIVFAPFLIKSTATILKEVKNSENYTQKMRSLILLLLLSVIVIYLFVVVIIIKISLT